MRAERARIGIMQPYFFPYLGHFALIANVDRWVVLDVTQYTPKSWMNRNRVLHPSGGWMYITAPVEGASQGKLIKEMMLHDPDATLKSLRGRLAHYRKRAPHFEAVAGLLEASFSGRADDSLVALDVASLEAVTEYLGLKFDYEICSGLGLDLSSIELAGQWALRIAEALGADEYVNPAGGAHLFDEEEFRVAGVQLSFIDIPSMVYDPKPFDFVEALSVLDVLMWNEPEKVVDFLRSRSTVRTAQGSSGVS
ncbi:MAG TPA: WbqC family protein [Acidimicrobiales bacterium]|nr:WbqC family protein [Acidimicrobiales bacterium]